MMNWFLGRFTATLTPRGRCTPIGFLFGLGFDTAGFVIVGVFVLTWIVALSTWRFAKLEQKWDTANATAEN